MMENQIEEMAQIIRNRLPHIGRPCLEGECISGDKNSVYNVPCWCVNKEIAEMLYNAGYRKQSEGEWEIVIGSNGKGKMICTNCRHQQDLASTFTYCPNCGARMYRVVYNFNTGGLESTALKGE